MRAGATLLILSLLLGIVPAANAQDGHAESYKGLWISTPFPSFNTAADQTVTLNLTVHNAGLPPQEVQLGVRQAGHDWSSAFLGNGERVQSVFVAPDSTASVKLRLEPTAKMAKGTQQLTITATGREKRFALPVDITIGPSLPPKLSLKPELPSLRGGPNSDFDFKVTVKNEGGKDTTVRMAADAPQGFRVTFTEEYGSQELTSLPIKVGQEKTIKVKVTPGYDTRKGSYPVVVRVTNGKTEARTRLTMDVTGEPKLTVSGQGQRLSADAEAGKETPIPVVLKNDGSAPARNINLNASPPTGWKVTFQPATLRELDPDQTKTVRALVTPAGKAIAGDYMMTVNADGKGVEKSADFRVTVQTSTMWGIAGVLVIGAALVVLVLAMMRFGRR